MGFEINVDGSKVVEDDVSGDGKRYTEYWNCLNLDDYLPIKPAASVVCLAIRLIP